MRRFLQSIAVVASVVGLFSTQPVAAQERVAIMVFDASGSMWNRMEGDITRIEIARDVMSQFFDSRDAAVPLSVIAYGHRRRGDCSDIEVVAPLGQQDAGSLAARIRGLNPQGMTPLTDSLALARQQIPATAESADIILVTDGLENCGGDPCALAAQLAAEGIDIRAHVVGFGLTQDEVNSLSCLPDLTGGMLFQTNSGAEMAEALTAVSVAEPLPAELQFRAVDARNGQPVGIADWTFTDAVTGAAVLDETSDAMPVAVFEPGLYRIAASLPGFAGQIEIAVENGMTGTIDVPLDKTLANLILEGVDTVTGAVITDVDWTLLNLADETSITSAGQGERLSLLVPAGDYRVEGVAGALRGGAGITAVLSEDQTLRVQMAELFPEIVLDAPDTAVGGSFVDVVWQADAIDDGDYLTIVEVGAPEGSYNDYAGAVSGSPARFRAPDGLGAHEIRYIARTGETLATRPITLIAAQVSLMAPDQGVASTRIEVEWTGPANPGDYITVVEVGAPEGTYNDYFSAETGGTARFRLPDALGAHEVRYVMSGSSRTVAMRPITLTPAIATISNVTPIVPGGFFSFEWTGPGTSGDYLTIVERGADEGRYNDYAGAERGSPVRLRAPDVPGEYELRYVIAGSQRTLVSLPVMVESGAVTLSLIGEARSGGTLSVEWTGPGRYEDFIEVVPAGSADDAPALRSARASQGSPLELFAPAAKGEFELRYRASDTGEVLARLTFVVSE